MLNKLLKMVKRKYHTFMHSYYYVLYKDCLDIQMKERYFQKVKNTHEKKAVCIS
jgi:hypothetical protein